MRVQEATLRCSAVIAGRGLAGMGMFFLHQNLASTIAGLNHMVHANGLAGLGILPSLTLGLSQIVPAAGLGNHSFLELLILHGLVLCWPLLLVTLGVTLSGIPATEHCRP